MQLPRTPLYPKRYRTRLRRNSGLPYQAIAIGLVIADLRDELSLKPHEPLAITDRTLADEASMSRRTLAKYLPLLSDSGWIHSDVPKRDGRHQKTRYWITEGETVAYTGRPQNGEKQGNQWPTRVANNGDTGRQRKALALTADLTTTRPSAAEESTSIENQNPDPSTLSTTTPGSVVATAEQILYEQWEQQRRDEQARELASPQRDPLSIRCRHCRVDAAQPCKGLDSVTPAYIERYGGRWHAERATDARRGIGVAS